MQWLESGEARRTHSEVERELRTQGEVLMRRMLQGHLDLRAEEEKRRYEAEGRQPDVQVRTRPRQLETGFGRVKVARLGHKVDGAPAVFPFERELNLPPEIYSLEVRQFTAIEAQRGSWEQVVEALNRYT